ncbi:hypothetical protein AX774_g3298, partial [Zancudomyces culisetae]
MHDLIFNMVLKVGSKKASPYNLFMKEHLADFKSKNPTFSHKDAFIRVAGMWKTSPENPKNMAGSEGKPAAATAEVAASHTSSTPPESTASHRDTKGKLKQHEQRNELSPGTTSAVQKSPRARPKEMSAHSTPQDQPSKSLGDTKKAGGKPAVASTLAATSSPKSTRGASKDATQTSSVETKKSGAQHKLYHHELRDTEVHGPYCPLTKHGEGEHAHLEIHPQQSMEQSRNERGQDASHGSDKSQ